MWKKQKWLSFWSYWYVIVHFYSFVLGCQASEQEWWLRVTLLWSKYCCFSNANYFVTVTRYEFPSQQGHLQSHSKSKVWQLSTQLLNGILEGLAWKVDALSSFSLKVSYEVNLHFKKIFFSVCSLKI